MKPNFQDIKTLVVNFPIERGFMVDWDGKNYNLNDEDELREWKNDYGMLLDPTDHDEIRLVIDVETGDIMTCPEDFCADFINVKLVDTGTYTLLDKDDDAVASYEGYVPDVLDLGGDGYGDYLNFEVKNEQIEDWKWNEELFEQFMENVTEED